MQQICKLNEAKRAHFPFPEAIPSFCCFVAAKPSFTSFADSNLFAFYKENGLRQPSLQEFQNQSIFAAKCNSHAKSSHDAQIFLNCVTID